MNLDQLIDTLRELPEPLIERVQDFAEFLKAKHLDDPTGIDNWFWSLLDVIDWSAESPDRALVPLIAALREGSIKRIYEFQDELARKLRDLDGPRYLHAFSDGPDGGSADAFLYARCFVVANGREFYHHVLRSPTAFPNSGDFEQLLYSVEAAYQAKTGKELDRFSEIDYETGHNKQKWGDETISYA